MRAIGDAVELGRRRDRPDVGEPAVAQHALVGRLAQHGDVLRQQVDRGLVEVVGVQVGDEHAVQARTSTSAGSGSSVSGLRRSLAVSATAGRAPAGSSIGSTSTQRPASSTIRVA